MNTYADIAKLKEKIRENELEIEDAESDIEIREDDIIDLRRKIDSLEYANNELEKQVKKIENDYVQVQSDSIGKRSYFALKHIDSFADREMDGQRKLEDYWAVCDGYVLICSKDKFVNIKELETPKNFMSYFDAHKLKEDSFILASDVINGNCEIRIEKEEELLKIDGYYFNLSFVKDVIYALNVSKDTKLTIALQISKSNNHAMLIECENGKALVLGVRVEEGDR